VEGQQATPNDSVEASITEQWQGDETIESRTPSPQTRHGEDARISETRGLRRESPPILGETVEDRQVGTSIPEQWQADEPGQKWEEQLLVERVPMEWWI
jgi:hypothetical protein